MSRVFSYAAYARIITGLQAGYLRLNGFARGLVEACGHPLCCLQSNLLLFLSANFPFGTTRCAQNNHVMRYLSFLTLIAFLFTSCGYLFLKEIECREFKTDHVKLFPGMPGDTITFVSADSLQKHFVVREKFIKHTKKYITDTGCSCRDLMQMLYTSGSDSIWSRYEENYIYDQPDQTYFEIFFVIDGVKSGFNGVHMDSAFVGRSGSNYGRQRKFRSTDGAKNAIAECLLAENVGLLEFRNGEGKTWTRRDAQNQRTDIESFVYDEGACH